MAKNKKWNKVIARIQALEDALAGLLRGKSAHGTKRKKARKKAPAKKPAKSKRKAPVKKPAPKPVKVRPKKSTATKPRNKNLRVAVAENAPILPQPPIPSL
jgi:hypothetical protein